MQHPVVAHEKSSPIKTNMKLSHFSRGLFFFSLFILLFFLFSPCMQFPLDISASHRIASPPRSLTQSPAQPRTPPVEHQNPTTIAMQHKPIIKIIINKMKKSPSPLKVSIHTHINPTWRAKVARAHPLAQKVHT
jgi:hypothetical protein